MSIEAGKRIGRYEINALIGAGGMGEVYRALDTELHRPVALKFLREEVAADEKRMQRFIQEARAASALNHPNILTVYEIGEADGTRFFATEFVDGVTLRAALVNRTMKLGEVLDVAIQIASALVAPSRLNSTGSSSAMGSAASDISQQSIQPTLADTERTGEVAGAVATNVSSAEYIVNQFKRHKWRFLIVLLLIALAGVGFGLYKFFGRSQSAQPGAVKVTPLTSSPYIERNVAFSPDGSRLAFVRSRIFAGDIYTVAVAGGEPARVTSDEASIFGLAWTRDGTELVFSSDRGGGNQTLWRVPAAGGTPTQVAGVGENISELSIARQGNRLAYAKASIDLNIYRLELTGQPGGQRTAGAPASFIASTRMEEDPQFSPDGHRVAFISDRSGSDEIWVCDADGKTPTQLTNLGSAHSHGASWSPDGRFIAFSGLVGGNADIYVVSAEGGSPRRLTTDPSGEITPSWSKDGRWIYFASNRAGRSEVWKIAAAGGEAVQLTHGGGNNPAESSDGHSVYYIRGPGRVGTRSEPGLWQVPAEGGEETRLFEENIDPGNWAVAVRGIYFLTRNPGQTQAQTQYTLSFFDFATRQTTPITTLEGPRGTFQLSGLTVSPDEHWVLYAQRDKLDFDLMLVENFR